VVCVLDEKCVNDVVEDVGAHDDGMMASLFEEGREEFESNNKTQENIGAHIGAQPFPTLCSVCLASIGANVAAHSLITRTRCSQDLSAKDSEEERCFRCVTVPPLFGQCLQSWRHMWLACRLWSVHQQHSHMMERNESKSHP